MTSWALGETPGTRKPPQAIYSDPQIPTYTLWCKFTQEGMGYLEPVPGQTI